MLKHLYRSLIFLLTICLFLIGCSSDIAEQKPLTIHWSDKKEPLVVKNADGPLTEVLGKNGHNVAKLKQNYKANVPWDKKISPGSQVKLLCNCTVDLYMGGKKTGTYKTTKATVGGFLTEKKVPVTSWHELKIKPDTKITNGLKVEIDQYEQRVKKTVTDISFDKKEEKDKNLEKGKKKIKVKGKKGKSVFEVVENLKNGKLVSTGEKRLVKEIDPVEEVVALGTLEPKKEEEDSEGPPTTGEKLTVQATAYTHTGNPTATGVMPKRGTIAVDPDVIPLGTRMYIPGYGYGTAQDTGGAVDGNIIDLFMNTEQECIQWGRRSVKITIRD